MVWVYMSSAKSVEYQGVLTEDDKGHTVEPCSNVCQYPEKEAELWGERPSLPQDEKHQHKTDNILYTLKHTLSEHL